jgi:DMSO reductase family type II enzyme heme b subunit
VTAVMKRTVTLMSAPPAVQPGGYVPVAYADRVSPRTGAVEIAVEPMGQGWRVTLDWECPEPVRDIATETDRFVDACAIFAPTDRESPWVTMGAPGQAVRGYLWRADRGEPWQVHAEGLGTMQRAVAVGAQANASWDSGRWRVVFTVPDWPALTSQRRLACAVWRGAAKERAGLKAVSPGWLEFA